jgi:amidase
MEVMQADVIVGSKKVPYDLPTFGYTSIFNLTGSPVVVIPVAVSQSGLPIGIQIVGRRWEDYKILDVAETIADITGTVGPPPGYA